MGDRLRDFSMKNVAFDLFCESAAAVVKLRRETQKNDLKRNQILLKNDVAVRKNGRFGET